ncbi:unnamed protein product [Nezara viridula]|uniref:Uncharacterized protein n=1 Tax=Nezara viridula TaxID=85310 RepID=A0A9P0MN32_NEZVI|nr:unnamed protein product [Nezara viridula]CAH1398710.1 unnamed protein product [Nezara viridula]
MLKKGSSKEWQEEPDEIAQETTELEKSHKSSDWDKYPKKDILSGHCCRMGEYGESIWLDQHIPLGRPRLSFEDHIFRPGRSRGTESIGEMSARETRRSGCDGWKDLLAEKHKGSSKRRSM